MVEWFNSLLDIATNAISQNTFRALVALFFVSALTEVGMPFPFIIDGALLVASYATGLFSFHLLYVMLALLLGRLVGSTVVFWLSRFAGEAFINWLEKHFPKLKLREKMVWLNARLNRKAPLAVAIARLTPGLLTAASIAAGSSGMQYYQFILGIVLESVIADGALIIIGAATRYGLTFLGFTPSIWGIVVLLPVIMLLVWFVRWLWMRRRNLKISVPK